MGLGDRREGVQSLIALDSTFLDPHYGMAELLSSQRQFERARTLKDISQRLDPMNAEVLIQEAIQSALMRMYDPAIQVIGRAIALDPNYFHAHQAFGDILFWKAERKKGVTEMETAVRLDPGPSQLARLGRMYGQMGRREDGRRVLADRKSVV